MLNYPQDLFGTDNSYTHIMAIQAIDVISSEFEETTQSDIVDISDLPDGQSINVRKDTSLTAEKLVTSSWIYVPAPSNINFTDTHNWEQGDLGKFRAFKYETVDWKMFGQDVGARVFDSAESLASDQKANAEDVRTQSVSNPHMEVLYKSPNFRTFSFQYKLIPFEDEDCKTILGIIRTLRHGAATDNSTEAFRDSAFAGRGRDLTVDFVNNFRPDDEDDFTGNDLFGSDNWLAYPQKFRIRFLLKRPDGSIIENPYISRIKTCVITELGVNYTSLGDFTSYENGFPTEIEMTLSFTEVELVKKSDVLRGF